MTRFTRPIALVLIISLAGLALPAATAQAKNAEKPKVEKPSKKKAKAPKKNTTKGKKRRAAFDKIVDNPKLPRVLLIGDSISIGYTVPVRKLLAKKANVHRIPTNGGDTVRGLTSMDKWLGKKPWDVIHFNFGLHDLKRLKGKKYDVTGKQVRSPKEYAKNLEKIVVRLKKTGATLIWASTTPVPEAARGRLQGDSVVFNREAAKIMKKHGVRVNDLYTYISPKLGKAQKPRDVHFTTAGKTLLGKKVAAEIETALKERKKTTKRKTNTKK